MTAIPRAARLWTPLLSLLGLLQPHPAAAISSELHGLRTEISGGMSAAYAELRPGDARSCVGAMWTRSGSLIGGLLEGAGSGGASRPAWAPAEVDRVEAAQVAGD